MLLMQLIRDSSEEFCENEIFLKQRFDYSICFMSAHIHD